MSETEPTPRGAGSVVAVLLVAALTAGVCGWLGLWQWDRARTRSAVVQEAPATPIADILSPSTDASEALGEYVTVSGRWGGDTAVVWGREVDGTPSAFLLRSLEVSADQTRTGEPATLVVLVGHRPESDTACPPAGGEEVALSGYLRRPEAPSAREDIPAPDLCGASVVTAMSTAELAQTWAGPLYAAILVLDGGADGWDAMPPRPVETQLNFQSLAYAFEWWAFGAFTVAIAGRWVRDNGRQRESETKGVGDG